MYKFLLCFLSILTPGFLLAVEEPKVAATAVEWEMRVSIASSEALADFPVQWGGEDLRVRLSQADGSGELLCLLKPRLSRILSAEGARFDPAFHDAVQITRMLPPATNETLVAVRRHRQGITLYLDGQPALRFPDRWEGELRVAVPSTAIPDEDVGGYVQRLADFRFEDDFMLPTNVPNALANWEILSGEWSPHSVTGNTSGTISRDLRRFPTPERSPNFYSLDGRGEHATIVAGESFYHMYAFRASVQHNAGTNGIVFMVEDDLEGHAFTVHTDEDTGRLVFSLWRGAHPGRGLGMFVEGVVTDLTPGQWLLLEVRVFDDRVVCLVDHVETIRRRLAMPPGGRFGLYSHASEGARFDDVAAWSHGEIALDGIQDLARNRRGGKGRLRESQAVLSLPASCLHLPVGRGGFAREPAGTESVRYVLGATNHPPARMDMLVAPRSRIWSVSLISGWRGDGQGHYRLDCENSGDGPRATLVWVASNRVTRLDAAPLPETIGDAFVLSLDASREGELHGLIDDRLLVWQPVEGSRTGAVGFNLSQGTEMDLSMPLVRAHTMKYTDRFEKNPLYVMDPFMRHWASPEGQWLTYPDRRSWYKSDVLRRVSVRLPAIVGQTNGLHMAVPDGQSNGCIRVAVNGEDLDLIARFDADSPEEVVASIPVKSLPESVVDEKGSRMRFYTARLFDGIFLLQCETGLLARCRLPQPLPGRRMMAEGLTVDQLHHSRVYREPVLDCLFTESLHDWNINGGTWEVINRFQCNPLWSHMNGENGDSLAALWSKYEIVGDFSIELTAGMRHGWYSRPGDLNLTILNRRDSPSEGYTLIPAGWDPDHSQRYNRLFRDGEMLARNDVYTVPRVREGQERRGFEPLVAPGRPVHGAWYTVRLRRNGNRLRGYFDNEKIFDLQDEDPLPSGSFGLWTYRNSMMVARVRVAAESIRPRSFHRRRITHLPSPAKDAIADRERRVDLMANGWPVDILRERWWSSADEVSRPRLDFRRGEEPAIMRVQSTQGGGTFMARSELPIIPADKLLGWRFEVARHPEARFNFEFSMGRFDGTNFVPVEPMSYVICGTDEERGPRRVVGQLPRVPPASPRHGRSERVWTPVLVWLPIERLDVPTFVRLDGFGNLQPSDVQQGLRGNAGGTWYEIRNFRPIFHGAPELTMTHEGHADAIKTLRAGLDGAASGRLRTLEIPSSLASPGTRIEWGATSAGEIALSGRIARRPPSSLSVSSTLPWPNALLTPDNVRLNGEPVKLTWLDGAELIVPLQRPLPGIDHPPTLEVTLNDGRTFRQIFGAAAMEQLHEQSHAMPPVLLSLEVGGQNGRYHNFERRSEDPSAYQLAQPPTLRFDDPRQQSYLRLSNRGTASRLQGILLERYDMVDWPLLQFRYRGDPMAQVSLQAVGYGLVNFTENLAGATVVRHGATGRVDRSWHSWMGIPADAVNPRPLRSGCALSPVRLQVGSIKNPDQTGLFSALDIDEVTTGPVAGKQRPLAFTARFDPSSEDLECVYALAAGPEPWETRSAHAREDLPWRATTNGVPTKVDTKGLPEGIHHLLVRARLRDGDWSRVADVPFLVDREPVTVSSAVVQTPGRYNGTALDVRLDAGAGALPRLSTLQVRCGDEPLDLKRDQLGRALYGPGEVRLEIDWPALLRRQIQQAGDGDRFVMSFSDLVDAANATSGTHEATITLDYASDKTPPTVPPVKTGTNFAWYLPVVEKPQELYTTVSRIHVSSGKDKEDGHPYVALKATSRTGLARKRFDPLWNTGRHPFLALSVRIDPASKKPSSAATLFRLRLRAEEAPRQARTTTLTVTPRTLADSVVHGNMAWEPGRWNDIVIDVPGLIRRTSGIRDAIDLRDLDILLSEKSPYVIQVRAVAVMRAWTPADRLVLRAYDASGIDGLYWQGGGHAPFTALRPALAALPEDDNTWMKLRVRDRAGNETAPYLVPMPPATNTKNVENLPVSEDWD